STRAKAVARRARFADAPRPRSPLVLMATTARSPPPRAGASLHSAAHARSVCCGPPLPRKTRATVTSSTSRTSLRPRQSTRCHSRRLPPTAITARGERGSRRSARKRRACCESSRRSASMLRMSHASSRRKASANSPSRSISCSNGSRSGATRSGRSLRGASGVAALFLLAGAAAAAAPIGSASVYPLSDLASLRSADRLLIVSPHPDDESLCCAGIAELALAAGARVTVVWLTSGDAFELDAGWVEHTLHPGRAGLRALGERRMQEARAAAGRLGIAKGDEYFLGFSDRGLLPLIVD